MASKIILLPGDGIGPEIIAPALEVLGAVGTSFEYEEHLFGGASIDAHGIALTDETLAACEASCVGGGISPCWVGGSSPVAGGWLIVIGGTFPGGAGCTCRACASVSPTGTGGGAGGGGGAPTISYIGSLADSWSTCWRVSAWNPR